MKKYVYAIGMAILVMLSFSAIFSYFGYHDRFLVGWFSCMGYYLVYNYQNDIESGR